MRVLWCVVARRNGVTATMNDDNAALWRNRQNIASRLDVLAENFANFDYESTLSMIVCMQCVCPFCFYSHMYHKFVFCAC